MEARQKQEIAELYKREGVSPLGAIGSVFMTMPIFLSI
jgi:membrane protein insertase Oxa1/YidC/SpoIIIJ